MIERENTRLGPQGQNDGTRDLIRLELFPAFFGDLAISRHKADTGKRRHVGQRTGDLVIDAIPIAQEIPFAA